MSGKFKYDSWKQKYSPIGCKSEEGGNGTVSFVQSNGKVFALKQLKPVFINGKNGVHAEKRNRFIQEIDTVRRNAPKVKGILPILDFSKEEYWYVMPKADPIMDYIKRNHLDINAIIKIVISLAETLSELHGQNITHRDIKPSNIYMYNRCPCFSDFGLVGLADQDIRQTKSNRGLGAIFTIAPEMKRNPKDADGRMADVFSLAKTTWMLLTGNELGFDGTYSGEDQVCALSYQKNLRSEHLVELEELLHDATDSFPNNRPTIEEFIKRIKAWLKIKEDTSAAQDSEWNFLSKVLFGKYIPRSAIWTGRKNIANVLDAIVKLPVYNHVFFPDGGGLDMEKVLYANEEGCLYIHTTLSGCYVVKPKALHFEGFPDFRWNYFLLELEELQAVDPENAQRNEEHLVEDTPGHYVSGKYVQYGVYDYDSGEKLPEGFREVVRCMRGKFLIVEKYGHYNGISATYDGRHNMCSTTDFRKYIERLGGIVQKAEAAGAKPENVYPALSQNPFQKQEMQTIARNRNRISRKTLLPHVLSLSFADCLEDCGQQKKIKYFFTMQERDGFSLTSRFTNSSYTLCKDGVLRREPHETEIYYAYDRTVGQCVSRACQERIVNKCVQLGCEMDDINIPSLAVELRRNGTPSHLVTKQEITNLMREADDRVHNVLVLDEDGYAHIIQDLKQTKWYPTSQEIWNAGNVYVGKYSSLSDADRAYACAITGWYSYLRRGHYVYSGEGIVSRDMTLDECIGAIKKICSEELANSFNEVSTETED